MGTTAAYIDLELFSTSDKFLQKLDNNEALLGSYPVDDECRIHVGIDSAQKASDMTKLELVEGK